MVTNLFGPTMDIPSPLWWQSLTHLEGLVCRAVFHPEDGGPPCSWTIGLKSGTYGPLWSAHRDHGVDGGVGYKAKHLGQTSSWETVSEHIWKVAERDIRFVMAQTQFGSPQR